MNLRPLFSLLGLNGPKETEEDRQNRITDWRNGRISKQFKLESSGPGFMDPFWSPPPETKELPEGWYIDDNGHYSCEFPPVDIQVQDFEAGEHEAYPAYLQTARMSDETSWSRFQMNAYWVGLHFHHWMGKNVPGFWDVFNYKRSENSNKVIRLVFEDQGEIIFYGTHGGYNNGHAQTDKQNATLVVKNDKGKTFRLLYESNIANPHRDICYPGEQDIEHVGFNLPPKDVHADNIISAYAIVAALGRQIRDKEIAPITARTQKPSI